MINRIAYEDLMRELRLEFRGFVEQIVECKFEAVYSEQTEEPYMAQAEVIFRLHRDKLGVPLDRDKDCRFWIELDAWNGVILWDYHGDLPEYHANRIKTGKLGDIGADSVAALPLRLEDCLRACLHGRRLTDRR
ncbi:hypothetical protein [Burkholderia semiarida]|uniref:hypothetical protein n=1 Tax=Burkholderia semiarida TaxID=2843303 RepID=UPI0023DD7C35|nr:hypothetical protein [Burkholderia semiarida]MDF3091440.1 hypothetical protein [Burkholderia semiarida]